MTLFTHVLPGAVLVEAVETAWTRMMTSPWHLVATAEVGRLEHEGIQAQVYIKIIRFDPGLLIDQPETKGLCAQL